MLPFGALIGLNLARGVGEITLKTGSIPTKILRRIGVSQRLDHPDYHRRAADITD